MISKPIGSLAIKMAKLTQRQRRVLVSAVLTIVALLIGATYTQTDLKQAVVANQPGLYEVLEVSDGDTIIVDMNGTSESIRLIGVDTPETHHPAKPVQCFGHAATEFTTHQLDGHLVRLEADPLNSNRDRYGRLLRYVYLDDDTLLNLAIIQAGYGFAYTSFPVSKKAEFVAAEQSARDRQAGLWSECDINYYDDGRVETEAAEKSI